MIADQFSGAASDRIERLQTTDGTRVFQRGLTGEATDDVLIGTSAGEVLTAGAGSDVLVGGGAQDTLTGRAGADVFLFARPSDSLAEAASRDTITDFSQSEGNLIALSGIDAHTGVAGDMDVFTSWPTRHGPCVLWQCPAPALAREAVRGIIWHLVIFLSKLYYRTIGSGAIDFGFAACFTVRKTGGGHVRSFLANRRPDGAP